MFTTIIQERFSLFQFKYSNLHKIFYVLFNYNNGSSGITGGSFLSATLGYWVDSARAGRGIAPMAVAMATDYCFRHLGLHRMEINIRPENTKSLRVVEKLGFRDEGLRKDFLHIAGEWCDHRSFALTAPEVPDGLVHRFTGSGRALRVSSGRLWKHR